MYYIYYFVLNIFTLLSTADGQYMASRIARAIQRETSTLKKLLTSYNQLVSMNQQLSWSQLTDLSSPVWTRQDQSEIDVPRSVQLSAIKAHQKMHRAREELELLKSEMSNTISFYAGQFNILNKVYNNIINSSTSLRPFDLGCLYLCGAKLCEIKRSILEHSHSFKQYVVFLPVSPELQAECECYNLPSPLHNSTVELDNAHVLSQADQPSTLFNGSFIATDQSGTSLLDTCHEADQLGTSAQETYNKADKLGTLQEICNEADKLGTLQETYNEANRFDTFSEKSLDATQPCTTQPESQNVSLRSLPKTGMPQNVPDESCHHEEPHVEGTSLQAVHVACVLTTDHTSNVNTTKEGVSKYVNLS